MDYNNPPELLPHKAEILFSHVSFILWNVTSQYT